MSELSKPSKVAELLGRHGLRPSKGLGQNFLVDQSALQKIVAAADLSSTDICLEVGPGLGTLTQELALHAKQVVAVEKDRKLTPVLAETVGSLDNVQVIFADALELDIESVLKPYTPPYKVVANLPYYITTPLVLRLLESGMSWDRMVFLVQKEVAQRMVARPGTSDYGSLSLAIRYYAEPEIVTTVAPGAFFPPPKVTSSVVLLKCHGDPRSHHAIENPQDFFFAVRSAFQQRRKTLLNALSGANPSIPRDMAREAIARANLNESVRGEALDISQFVELANAIHFLRGSM